MQLEIGTCTECREGIQEPICPRCVKRGIESWLKKVKPSSIQELRRISEEFFFVPEQGSRTMCIKCHEPFGVCSWCYLETIQDWMRSLRKPLREEFSTYYNMKLRQ